MSRISRRLPGWSVAALIALAVTIQFAPRTSKGRSEEVLHRETPPAAYGVMHAHARLTAADMERLASGLSNTIGIAVAEEQDERGRWPTAHNGSKVSCDGCDRSVCGGA